MQQYEFQAQSKKLLSLMIHSIYTNKEIFLRELISNASDAIDKLLWLGLTDQTVTLTRETAEIRLTLDKPNRTLTVSDNGVGMNREELQQNLGVIAHSGSAQFREALDAEGQTAAELIGQFGVGFYSAFMVADRVAVVSRKQGEQEAWRWESDGLEGYSIVPAVREACGTDVILHIKPDGKEQDEYSRYLREYPIYKLVKKYSDYVRFPIRMLMPQPRLKAGSTPENPEFEEEFVLETFNTMIPLWERPKEELKRADYDDFYRVRYNDPEKPAKVVRVSVEGSVRYKALIFLPAVRPKDYDTDLWKPGLELYCAGVKVMDRCEALLPEEFRFARGVVEAPDLNLNLSREQLQQDDGRRFSFCLWFREYCPASENESGDAAEDEAAEVKKQQGEEIFLQVAVHAEEDQEADARGGQKAAHHAAEGDAAFEEEVGKHHAGGAVRDEPDKAGQHFADEGLVQDEMLEVFGADGFHGETDDDGGNEQEKSDLQRMEDRALEDAVLAFAAFLFTDGFDGFFAVFRAVPADEVDAEAYDDADSALVAEDLQDQTDLSLAGDQDGQHFVGSGEEDRKQCAAGHDAAGVEVGHGGGETALRDHADKAPGNGRPAAGAADGLGAFLLCPVFEPLHEEVGQKQEGDGLKRVQKCFFQNIYDHKRQ